MPRLLAAWLAAAALCAALPASGDGPPAFKISIREGGVYGVTYAELAAAGLTGEPASQDLALANRGEPVPLWVEDGGDGRFGPGDHLELVGEHLAGESTYFNRESDLNVYRLTLTGGGARMQPPEVPEPAAASAAPLWVREHLEEDRILLRFAPTATDGEPELWYWAKLTHIDPRPLRLRLDLRERLAAPGAPVSLKLRFRGWSYSRRTRQPEPLADHRVEVRLGGVMLGAAEWNGQEARELEIAAVPEEALDGRWAEVEVSVPARPRAPGEDPVIDVVVLDWVEVAYRRNDFAVRAQERVFLDPQAAGGAVRLTALTGGEVTAYGDGGSRIAPDATTLVPGEERVVQSFTAPESDRMLRLVPAGTLLSPVAVALDRPSGLRDTDIQADYVIVAHPRLLEAIEPLARFHRESGLAVTVVSVEDVYDEFNDGILHPRAIRDFLSCAYHRWRRPAPRYVLLVGDASWDPKNREVDDRNYADWTYRPGEVQRFWKNASTGYDESARNDRNLIPTGHYAYFEGHVASDNYFVAVDGEDFRPAMAVGRFPVTEPEEVAAIVDKTLAYAAGSELGPWRSRVMWITSEQAGWQRRSDDLARELAARGFAGRKVYPESGETTNLEHQTSIRDALDEGQLLVHFLGHGGRYIWRTGPSDLKTNRDLFTLEHLDTLAPSSRLPVVLSLTCYSAPFDHPSADSIGEKFLRLPGRGAVAVVGAAWRNAPAVALDRALVEEFTRPGRIGDAFLRAKRRLGFRDPVELYNLLGDPAAPLALPALTAQVAAGEAGEVDVEVPAPDFIGRALVEWLDGDGTVLASEEEAVAASRFSVHAPESNLGARRVLVYAWSPEAGVDAAGAAELPAPADAAVAATPPEAAGKPGEKE